MTVAEVTVSSVTVSVPLSVRRRNGRPRIVLPDSADAPDGDKARVTLLQAIARAWHWRRQMESGEAATLSDIAAAEKVTRPFVSRVIRLAFLSPSAMEQLVTGARELEIAVYDLAATALVPWAEQGR